jgi:hypothetical protein
MFAFTHTSPAVHVDMPQLKLVELGHGPELTLHVPLLQEAEWFIPPGQAPGYSQIVADGHPHASPAVGRFAGHVGFRHAPEITFHVCPSHVATSTSQHG